MSRQVIYLDVLIALNLFVNYFILIAVVKFLYLRVKQRRIILSAFLGALFSVYILMPEINVILSMLIKLMMSFLIVFSAIGIKKKKIFVKFCLCFYLMSFTFSGVNFVIWVLFKPNGMVVKDGIVYFNISPIVLIISTVFAYFLLRVINNIIGKHECKENFCRVTIEISKKIVSFDARVDTGNNLKEPFSNLPVIITSQKTLDSILPNDANISDLESIQEVYSVLKASGCMTRLVPFNTVSGSGLLVAFKPDSAVIKTSNGNITRECYVAICPNSRLSGETALVGADFFL
ncbi:MAG: sigma-E processing peptidase SpoIIGA [Candidatus Improbicoccus devescovinae]|nr:MAG: sigma-E processing peptidase SpoIIGA [Candidatus Improbicoccus devescovinae]